MNLIGLGNPEAQLSVYIENIPPLGQYQNLKVCRPMQAGEIQMIAEQTGNHWRKIFNIYAKLIFELYSMPEKSWQIFRERELLQQNSNQNLLFNLSSEAILKNITTKNITIIMGKTYATKLGFSESCHWLSPDFAININKRLIICPYFDYRQLSNIKISKLCQLIKSLS